jgi:pyruvate carboxylase
MMVINNLSPADVLNPEVDIAFPESVVSLFKGELGFPPDGFPEDLSRRVLRTEPPMPYRPGDRLNPVELEVVRAEGAEICRVPLDDQQLASYLMYPKQAAEYHAHVRDFSDTSILPTPTFLFGLQEQEEISVDIDPGKTLLIKLLGRQQEGEGQTKVLFELNGQARSAIVEQRVDKVAQAGRQRRRAADPENPLHVAAPMPGTIVSITVQAGQCISAGTILLCVEAMKMETNIAADFDCEVVAVHANPGELVAAKDLLIELKLRED